MSLSLKLPLHGTHLIEASAGTGKTFTIALLYVRLVLGHRWADAGSDTPLIPPEILVVTFTDAASQELRDRIRARLVQAAAAFRATPPDNDLAKSDVALARLRQTVDPAAWPVCAYRLTLAAEWMDDAAISTIHSWCQRMLREHAFDSGNLFRQTLVKDLTDATREAVNDYWRTRIYPLDPPQAKLLIQVLESPDALQRQLRTLLDRDDLTLVSAGEPLTAAATSDITITTLLDKALQADQKQHKAEANARQSCVHQLDTIRATLRDLRNDMNGTTFTGKNNDAIFAGWLKELTDWAEERLALADARFVQKLAHSRLKLRAHAQRPDLPLCKPLDVWHAAREELSEAMDTLKPQVIADARCWVAERLAEQLRSRAEISFNDMIRGLDRALSSAGGEALAARIREQFPVAMIDEFQDTDPAQYRIFARIYRVGAAASPKVPAHAPRTALILIGDPKQAIYSFRGGDIHTYLGARRATAGNHHSLDTNFRSSLAAVAAVNRVFGFAEATHPRRAFRFAGESAADGPAVDNPLPYRSVSANGVRAMLRLDGNAVSGLTGWLLPGDQGSGFLNRKAYLRVAAAYCANRVADWLNQANAAPVGAGFVDPEADAVKPLQANDIAILVRDRNEAAAIRQALARRGLASVYLSDRDSVFATDEARDLLYWLRAMANPGSVSALRSALATRSLGLSLAELDQLQHDESAWECIQERFLDYQQRWTRHGVLPALRRLLHDFQVPQQMLRNEEQGQGQGQEQGQRRLTNLLHLAEWAQEASDTLDGNHALVRQLAEQIQAPSGTEQILRLESDAALIQVVTIFKSKGLEYPLVCLPFLCTYKEVNGKYGTPLFHKQDQAMLELASKQNAANSYQKADDERLSEDVRLLYVALTRARHATFVGLAPLRVGNVQTTTLAKSALGYLLAGMEPIADLAALRDRWRAMAQDCPAIQLVETMQRDDSHQRDASIQPKGAIRPDETVCMFQDAQRNTPTVPDKPARTPTHRPFVAWWIASYSSLQQLGMAAPETRTEREALTAPEMRMEREALPAPETLTAPETLAAEIHDEEYGDTVAAVSVSAVTVPSGTLHAFPRGPGPGTFLHGVLRTLAEHGFAAARDDRALLDRLAQRCRRRGWEAQEPVLRAALLRWIDTPLSAVDDHASPGPVLTQLVHTRAEPDFWFATHNSHTRTIDKLTREAFFPGVPRPQLAGQRLNGLLKGFIDLIVEHNGQFLVIDWKSNWLGPDESAYHADALRDAMLAKRYDVQLALYLIALHRHLVQSLPNYDYDQHVGGAMLVFLRGIDAPSRGVCRLKPPRAFIEALDRCLLGQPDT